MVKSALYAGLDEIIAFPFAGRSIMGNVTSVLVNPKPLIDKGGRLTPDHPEALYALENHPDQLM
jgi:hypothetical protein